MTGLMLGSHYLFYSESNFVLPNLLTLARFFVIPGVQIDSFDPKPNYYSDLEAEQHDSHQL